MGCGASNEQPTTTPKDSKLNQSNSKQQTKGNVTPVQKDTKNMSNSRSSNPKITNSRSVQKNPTKNDTNLRTSRTGTGNSSTKSDEKSIRESTKSLNKSVRNLDVSPSKIKLSVKEIPEEELNSGIKKGKKRKKE